MLYKNRPARVRHIDDKLEIELGQGETQRVRPKDVELLHPGPLGGLGELRPTSGEVQTAWELLAGTTTTLEDLAELAYGAYTPQTAWAAWQLVEDGLYFRGTLDEIEVSTPQDVAETLAKREADEAESRAWEQAMARFRSGTFTTEDERYVAEVEDLALGRRKGSRVLSELGRAEDPQEAHAFLLQLGYWDEMVNPYPVRLGVPTTPPEGDLPELPDERRADLTHLPAFAIDDAGSATPDDAVSLEGNRLWVHVADVAALVPPNSAPDLDARERASSLHLPEEMVPMLPPRATECLGLGLSTTSPALSIAMDLGPDTQIQGIEVVPSWVQVTRLTYEEAEGGLESEPLAGLWRLAEAGRARREGTGAITFDLPEVDIKVDDGQVSLRPVAPLRSRSVVREAMILAGEGVARFALQEGLPVPFMAHEPSEAIAEHPRTLAEMYASVRKMRRSQYRSAPSRHAGLGLEAYVQATSPLRRYLDLVVHQQLRAYLRGTDILPDQDILERVGAVEAAMGPLRAAERLSEKHWTLVYLMHHAKWRGEGVLVDKRGRSGTVLIPELGLETRLRLSSDLPLDSRVALQLQKVDLAHLEAWFQPVR